MSELTVHQQRMLQWSELKRERSSWMPHWQEISRHLLPRAGRFFTQDHNSGTRKHNAIYDSTGTRALRTLAAGLMSNMTSPARPWFRLTTSDPKLDEDDDVKRWLADVTRLMNMVFNKSNTYRSLHTMYEELGAFGTAGTIVLPNFKSVIHHHTLTTGEYAFAVDYQGVPNVLYREFEMTVAQMVREFGRDNCSLTVRNLYDRGATEAYALVMHVIALRMQRDTRMKNSRNLPWESVYFEPGEREGRVLRESGFTKFRALLPRWSINSGDIYGNSPGMEALGDIKQLQHEQLRKAEAIDYMTKPPMQAPPGAKEQEINLFPGGISYLPQTGQGGGLKAAFESRLDLSHLLGDIQDVRHRIDSTFYADLFLMMANDTRSGTTATEVAERHEEKMLMLGPVVERQHNELLSPKIEMAFDEMIEADILPPAPESMQGRELSVEFVSVLAQAQRAISTNSVDRYVMSLGTVAQFKPDVVDKFDSDKWADSYADMLGVDPELIVPGKQVVMIREARAKAKQAEQTMAMAEQAAGAAQKLGTVNTPSGNAGNDVLRAFSGYA